MFLAGVVAGAVGLGLFVVELTVALGGNGAALALLVAWAIPDLLALLRHQDFDGDLLGTALAAVVIALMPLVVQWPGPSWISDLVGVLGGVAIGVPLALTQDF